MDINQIPQETEGRYGVGVQSNRQQIPESVIKWRMDTSDVMKDLREDLKVLGNDMLVRRAMSILKSSINKATIQGHIKDEDRASEIALQFADDETEHIGVNYEAYEMKPENRDMYIDILSVYIFMGLTRPIQDWERRHTVDQGQERITTTQGIQSVLPLYPGQNYQQQPQRRHLTL